MTAGTGGPADLAAALDLVKRSGYVVLKEKSYRAAQERQRRAECRREWAEEQAKRAETWARDCLTEERRLCDRLTFVYGVAQKFGATVGDLRQEHPGHTPEQAALSALEWLRNAQVSCGLDDAIDALVRALDEKEAGSDD